MNWFGIFGWVIIEAFLIAGAYHLIKSLFTEQQRLFQSVVWSAIALFCIFESWYFLMIKPFTLGVTL